MAEETPYRIDREEMIASVMTMRQTAKMLIAFKKGHPIIFPGDDELWARDIEQLAHIIDQYDSLIGKLIEINLQQSDLMDQMAERVNTLLQSRDA